MHKRDYANCSKHHAASHNQGPPRHTEKQSLETVKSELSPTFERHHQITERKYYKTTYTKTKANAQYPQVQTSSNTPFSSSRNNTGPNRRNHHPYTIHGPSMNRETNEIFPFNNLIKERIFDLLKYLRIFGCHVYSMCNLATLMPAGELGKLYAVSPILATSSVRHVMGSA